MDTEGGFRFIRGFSPPHQDLITFITTEAALSFHS